MLLAVLSLCSGVLAADSSELIANGDFESLDANGGAEGWGIRNWGDTTLAAAKMATGGVVGPRCLSLQARSGPLLFGCFSRPAAVEGIPSGQILLTVYYRTEGKATPDLQLTTFAEDFAAKEWKTPVLTAEAVTLEPAPKWRTMSWRVRLLPSARQAVVVARIHGAGALYLDGVSLRPYPPPVQCELLAPGVATNAKGDRECQLRLTNHSGEAFAVRVNLEATSSAPKGPKAAKSIAVKVGPGKPEQVGIPYSFPLDKLALVAVTVLQDKGSEIYDQVQTVAPGLIDGRVVSPAFRATLLPRLPVSEIVAEGKVNARDELRRQIKLQGKLVGLGLDLAEVPVDDAGRWQVKTPMTGMLTGDYAVQIRATIDGKQVAELSLPLVKPAPKPSEAGYDARLRLHVGDQMRLPIGVFMATDEADLRAVAEAGFNTVVLSSRVASSALMETAASLGLSVIISSATPDQEFWRNQLERHGEAPHLAGWYILQRPEAQSPPTPPAVVAAIQGGLADVDPRHPVALAVGSLSRLEEYMPFCDVLMPWTEPEPVGDLRSVDILVARSVELCGTIKPVWPIIQMTGGAYSNDARLDPAGNGRPPTPAEYRCMAYLALARGGNGVFSYAFRTPPGGDMPPYLVAREAPELWAEVKQVNQELRALTPVLLEGEPAAVSCASLEVALRCFKYRDAFYVFAANPSASAATVTLEIPGMQSSELEVAFGTRKVLGQAAGRFADRLEPYGVRVYMGR